MRPEQVVKLLEKSLILFLKKFLFFFIYVLYILYGGPLILRKEVMPFFFLEWFDHQKYSQSLLKCDKC